jgi:hypothetical protein
VNSFYEAFFGQIAGLKAVAEAGFKKCKDGHNPLCSEAGGWCEWPKGANEDEVLKWFAKLVNTLVKFAQDHGWTATTRRKFLALKARYRFYEGQRRTQTPLVAYSLVQWYCQEPLAPPRRPIILSSSPQNAAMTYLTHTSCYWLWRCVVPVPD